MRWIRILRNQLLVIWIISTSLYVFFDSDRVSKFIQSLLSKLGVQISYAVTLSTTETVAAIFITTVSLTLATIYIRRLSPPITKAILERQKTNTSKTTTTSSVLAERYLAKGYLSSLLCSSGMVLLAMTAIYIGDFSTTILCVIAALLINTDRLLTEFRVRRGYFGSNMDEAIELIAFAIKEREREGGPPNTTHIVRNRSHQEDRVGAELEGAR